MVDAHVEATLDSEATLWLLGQNLKSSCYKAHCLFDVTNK